jgi:glutathione reductase (NADPH)
MDDLGFTQQSTIDNFAFPAGAGEVPIDDSDVDLVVIGGGSGGLRAARVAAGHGAKVMLVEESRLGGTCVIRGCVPKKLFVYASRFSGLLEGASELGWRLSLPQFDWPTLVAAKDKEIARLEALYGQSQERAGVEVVLSRAVLEDANTIHLLSNGRRVRATIILVATGARPELAEIEGLELGITSDEVFDLKQFPKRLIVGGAGYIAMEFAGLFAALGSDVTVVCRGSNVLRGFDEDIRNALAASYTNRGIKLLLGDNITRLERRSLEPQAPGRLAVETAQGARLIADEVLMAFGRAPNTRGIGLERAGVATGDDGSIIVDANSRTSAPNIFAIGDVTNRYNLTPVAIREAHAFADSVFGNRQWQVNYSYVPTAVFSSPEIGVVGLTELKAREKYAAVDVYKTHFRPLKATIAGDSEAALLKLVVDGDSQRILGAHLFADEASEMTQTLAVAIRVGALIDDFFSVMALHPTFGEKVVGMRHPSARYDGR